MGDAPGHTSGFDGLPVHRGAGVSGLRVAFGMVAGLSLLACAGVGEDSATGEESGAVPATEEPAPLDVLLVFDTSASMAEEGGALVLAADDIVAALGDEDWRFGITTTSADYSAGPTGEIDPGEAGTLVGEVIEPGDGAVEALRQQLACRTVYFKSNDLPSDREYAGSPGSCGEPDSGIVSIEYLDCLCPDGWNEDSGSGNEEGLEAAVDTLCRGEDPPESCFDASAPITAADAGSVDLWREGSRRRIWVISDEGDGSRRLTTGDDSPDVYLDLFEELGGPRFSVLGPHYVDLDGSCLNGAQGWGVERYRAAAEGTGGVYLSLTDGADEGCEPHDAGDRFAEALADDH